MLTKLDERAKHLIKLLSTDVGLLRNKEAKKLTILNLGKSKLLNVHFLYIKQLKLTNCNNIFSDPTWNCLYVCELHFKD